MGREGRGPGLGRSCPRLPPASDITHPHPHRPFSPPLLIFSPFSQAGRFWGGNLNKKKVDGKTHVCLYMYTITSRQCDMEYVFLIRWKSRELTWREGKGPCNCILIERLQCCGPSFQAPLALPIAIAMPTPCGCTIKAVLWISKNMPLNFSVPA